MPNPSPLAAAASAFNAQYGQPPLPRPTMPFATSPQGQQDMLALRTRLMSDLGMSAPRAPQVGTDPLSTMAMAYNSRTPAFVPPQDQAQEAMNQRQYAAHDAAMNDQDEAFRQKVEAFNLANNVGAQGRAPAPPIGAPATSGLSPDLAAMAEQYNRSHAGAWSGGPQSSEGGRLDEVARLNPMRPGYRPAPIGTPSPSRAAELRAQQPVQQLNPADAMNQLRDLTTGLINQAKVVPGRSAPVMQLPNQGGAGLAGKQGLAERLRDQLPPELQAQVNMPTGIQGSSKTRDGALIAGSREYWDKRLQNPTYLAAEAKREKRAEDVQTARTTRAQDERMIANGIDPSFQRAMVALQQGGAGGGPNIVGGMNPAQLLALGRAFGPEVVQSAIQAQAAAAPQMVAAQVAAGQLGLQNQIAADNRQQKQQEANTAFTPDHAGAVSRVRAKGGFQNLTPQEKRMAVLDSLRSHNNWITSAEEKGAFNDLNISTEEALAALGGKLPPHQKQWNWLDSKEVARRRELEGLAPLPKADPLAAPFQAGMMGL